MMAKANSAKGQALKNDISDKSLIFFDLLFNFIFRKNPVMILFAEKSKNADQNANFANFLDRLDHVFLDIWAYTSLSAYAMQREYYP